MTESSNTPFFASQVPSKWLPDLRYPNTKKWYNTKTWICESVADALAYSPPTGRHIEDVNMARRLWTTDTAAATRTAAWSDTFQGLDLTTPAYMLAGTGDTDDTLVGLDFVNAPKQMVDDITALNAINDITNGTNTRLWMRVLAVNHKFSFINFSRFPLEIFCTMVNVGLSMDSLLSTTAPHDDITSSQYKILTIPGNLDVGDNGVKRTWDVKFDLKRLFPDEYEKQPQHHGGDATTDHASSPWVGLQTGNLPTYSSLPPGQATAYTPEDPNEQALITIPSIRLKFFCKLQIPLQLGSASAGTHGSTGEVTDLRGFLLHADMSWLVNYYHTRKTVVDHPGLKAYPLQTA